MTESPSEYEIIANAYAFLGASLLKPMSQTPRLGLDPGFWDAFTAFDSDAVGDAARSLAAFASSVSDQEEAVEKVSVEWTRLFVGPPKPAAAPWESFYRVKDPKSGFGPATFEMQELLRARGLAISGDSNQYADHIGIELMLLAEMCRKATALEDFEEIGGFLSEHLLGWIGSFEEAIAAHEPDGYYRRVIVLVKALLEMQAAALQGGSTL